MRFDYSSLLQKQRPAHKGDAFYVRHPPMPRERRAKIFAPFAALKGFEEAINEKETEVSQADDS